MGNKIINLTGGGEKLSSTRIASGDYTSTIYNVPYGTTFSASIVSTNNSMNPDTLNITSGTVTSDIAIQASPATNKQIVYISNQDWWDFCKDNGTTVKITIPEGINRLFFSSEKYPEYSNKYLDVYPGEWTIEGYLRDTSGTHGGSRSTGMRLIAPDGTITRIEYVSGTGNSQAFGRFSIIGVP